MLFVESVRYVMVSRVDSGRCYWVYVKWRVLNLHKERLYVENILLNVLSRKADWAMGWKVPGTNPGAGYGVIFSPKHPDWPWGAFSVV